MSIQHIGHKSQFLYQHFLCGWAKKKLRNIPDLLQVEDVIWGFNRLAKKWRKWQKVSLIWSVDVSIALVYTFVTVPNLRVSSSLKIEKDPRVSWFPERTSPYFIAPPKKAREYK